MVRKRFLCDEVFAARWVHANGQVLPGPRSAVSVLDWRAGEEIRVVQLAREHANALPVRRKVREQPQ